MPVPRLELVASLDLGPTVDKVKNDIALDFVHYSLLRDVADAKLYQLMGHLHRTDSPHAHDQHAQEQLRKLQDACLRVSHLIQTSCLALRRVQLSAKDQDLARQTLEAQVALLQACLRRSRGSFDQSA